MSDPFWFLDNLDESEPAESKFEQNGQSENDQPSSNEDIDLTPLDFSKENDSMNLEQSNQEKTTTNINGADIHSESGGMRNKQILEDESDSIENLLFNVSDDTDYDNNIEKVNITSDTKNYRQSSADVSSFEDDSELFSDQNSEDSSIKEDSTKLLITLNSNDKKRGAGKYKELQISRDLSKNGDQAGEKNQQKIYVILNDGKYAGGGNDIQSETSDANAKYYTEAGSAVINLNDFITPQSKQMSGNEIITTYVNPTGGKTDDGKTKVELVITIKDQRKKSGKNSKSSKSVDSFNDSSDWKNNSRNRRVWDNTDYSSNQTTWETTKYFDRNKSKAQDEPEWSEETRDSFIRESDGARCVRTMWTTPQGKKVQTKCHKEVKPVPRQRRAYERGNRGSNLSLNSLLRDLDNELDDLFGSVNRMMYF